MIDITSVVLFFTSYLLGSISFSYWIGRLFYKVDIREHGSGNAGATNTGRVLGKNAGITCLLLDILKGVICVLIARFVFSEQRAELLGMLFGFACLMGHIFPVFSQFRGGKGVATTLGIIGAVNYEILIFSIVFFALVFGVSKIVSLSSLLSSVLVCITVVFVLPERYDILYKCFSLGIVVLFALTHHDNIGRLMNGNEKKFNFKKSNA